MNHARNKNKQDIRRIAYAKFQLWWILQHGYSVEDIFKLVPAWLSDRDENNPEDTFSNWFFENGFCGEIYPCFDEFLTSEYRDNGLMMTLLSQKEYAEYCIIDTPGILPH